MPSKSSNTMPPLPKTQCGVEYRHCPGRPAYAVSNTGIVLSCKRRGGRFALQWLRTHPTPKETGHLTVMLSRDGHKPYRVGVHRLVLEAFVGPCPPGMECRHFPDHTPTNNSVGNLVWGTRKQNCDDRDRAGRYKCNPSPGEANHFAKITAATVRKIHALGSSMTFAAIGKKFSVSESGVSTICRGKSWRHLKLKPILRPAFRTTKLSERDVLTIRRLCAKGVRRKSIASRFGVSGGTINDIFAGRRRSNVA